MTECETCGPVEHQMIPEDEAHCGCDDGVMLDHPAVELADGTIQYHLCDCPCHYEAAF